MSGLLSNALGPAGAGRISVTGREALEGSKLSAQRAVLENLHRFTFSQIFLFNVDMVSSLSKRVQELMRKLTVGRREAD